MYLWSLISWLRRTKLIDLNGLIGLRWIDQKPLQQVSILFGQRQPWLCLLLLPFLHLLKCFRAILWHHVDCGVVEFCKTRVWAARRVISNRSQRHRHVCLTVLRVEVTNQIVRGCNLRKLPQTGLWHGRRFEHIIVFIGRGAYWIFWIKRWLLALRRFIRFGSQFELIRAEIQRLAISSPRFLLLIDDCFDECRWVALQASWSLQLLHLLVFDGVQLFQDCDLLSHFFHLQILSV